jgi:hypothetical protein
MPRIRAVVMHEEYRVIRTGQPSLPPPKKGGGGGWIIAGGLLGALVVIAKLAGGDAAPGPAAPSIHETGRRVLASAKIENDRCHLPGFANRVPVVYEIDTGDPIDADFSNIWVSRLGLKNLQYREIWPGTRYGKIADAAVDIRVGDWVIKNGGARIYANWKYTFGEDEEHPLLGLAALQKRGVRLEVEGDSCRLTVAR